jgi:hypothetical protein
MRSPLFVSESLNYHKQHTSNRKTKQWVFMLLFWHVLLHDPARLYKHLNLDNLVGANLGLASGLIYMVDCANFVEVLGWYMSYRFLVPHIPLGQNNGGVVCQLTVVGLDMGVLWGREWPWVLHERDMVFIYKWMQRRLAILYFEE